MHALSTEDCAEADVSGNEQEETHLKGYRKRWSTKQSEQPTFDITDDELLNGSDSFQHGTDVSGKKPRLVQQSAPFSVVDGTVDEFVDCPVPSSSTTVGGHKLQRDALLGTNLNVFKYP